MKRNEPFNPSIKSESSPIGLIFRLATRRDCNSINILMAERNPSVSFSNIEAGTNREIDRVESDDGYKLYVAELNNEVIGFCRFYHSESIPADRKIYPSPEGWYGMGMLVSPNFRRRNIAHFLTLKRIEILINMGVREFYSIVDSNNLTSMKMHQNFGYVEVGRASGFLDISFNGGATCLFRLLI